MIRLRMLAVFVLQAILPATYNLRLTDLQLELGLNDAEFGLMLMGMTVGAVLSFPLAAPLLERVGTRRMIGWTYVIGSLATALMGLAPSGSALFAVLLVGSAGHALSNIAINVEADRVELLTGRRIMSLCHGLWSVTFTASWAAAGLVRSFGVAPFPHLLAMSVAMLALVAILVLPMSEAPPRAHTGAKSPRLVRPTLAILVLAAFGLGGDLLEGASRIWATIFLRDSFPSTQLVQSAGLFALLVTMALSRLLADRAIERFGPARVGSWSIVLAIIGVTVVVVAPTVEVAIAGFFVAGFGAGPIYPLMISSAARLGDRPAAENVAAITFLFQMIMLLAPFLVGLISEGFGVRVAYALLLPLLCLGWLAARHLPRE